MNPSDLPASALGGGDGKGAKVGMEVEDWDAVHADVEGEDAEAPEALKRKIGEAPAGLLKRKREKDEREVEEESGEEDGSEDDGDEGEGEEEAKPADHPHAGGLSKFLHAQGPAVSREPAHKKKKARKRRQNTHKKLLDQQRESAKLDPRLQPASSMTKTRHKRKDQRGKNEDSKGRIRKEGDTRRRSGKKMSEQKA